MSGTLSWSRSSRPASLCRSCWDLEGSMEKGGPTGPGGPRGLQRRAQRQRPAHGLQRHLRHAGLLTQRPGDELMSPPPSPPFRLCWEGEGGGGRGGVATSSRSETEEVLHKHAFKRILKKSERMIYFLFIFKLSESLSSVLVCTLVTRGTSSNAVTKKN